MFKTLLISIMFTCLLILLTFYSAIAQSECLLDDARWAYDTESNILRVCQETDEGFLMCVQFPEKVKVIKDLDNPFNL
jgi:hypothetical protein